MNSHLARLAGAMCLGLATFAPIVLADSFVPQRLFSLSYGSGPGAIGIWVPPAGLETGPPAGPTAIAVGPDGSVYIGDRVNKRIQRFSAGGELLMQMPGPLDRKMEHIARETARGWGAEHPPRVMELENIQNIAVDRQGCVFVLFGMMDLLGKFGADGKGLWYMAISDELPGPFGAIVLGPEGSVCIRLQTAPPSLAVMDSDGNLVKVVTGYACTPDGRIAAFERSLASSLAANVRFYDMEGLELASFAIDPASTDPALFAGDASFSGTQFDARGNLYKFALAHRDHPIAISPQLSIGCDEIVVRFDASGHPVAGIRFAGDPFPTGRSSTVDYAGNINRLAYGADSLDVVRYVLDTSTQGYTSTRDY